MNCGGSIDFDGFCDWIANDEDIQEFFLEYMQYQTREHAMKHYEALYHKYMDCFNVAAGAIVNLEEEKKIAMVLVLSHTHARYRLTGPSCVTSWF